MELTQLWHGERFDDGRPKVPDSILDRIRGVKMEEAWGYLLRQGYPFQYEEGLKSTQPGMKLVGRAVTAVMVPARPDMLEAAMKSLAAEGKRGMFQWVLDELVENDVIVADCYDKVRNCTFLGGNLSTNIARRTVRGGAVIWGGIRDLEQIQEITSIQIYYRKTDPGWMRDGLISAANRPCRIGRATCLPGDVVFGTVSGVLFIPPHMAEDMVINAEKTKVRDIFGFDRLSSGVYTAGQIDTRWSSEIFGDFMEWFKSDSRADPFRHLDWSEEIEEARRVDDGMQTTIG
jgi:regulator of RNase E activity RraA